MSKLDKRNGPFSRGLLSPDPLGIEEAFDHIFSTNSWIPADWPTVPEPLRTLRTPFDDALVNVARHPVTSRKKEDGSIEVEFDVPGCEKEDLKITFNEDTGILHVASNTIEERTSSTHSSVEQRSFSYQFRLSNIDTETISATCEKGVLKVTAAPLVVTPNTRTIEIK